jgi:hypothetical protein
MSVKVSSSVQRMATGQGRDRPEIRVHQPTSSPSESVTTSNTRARNQDSQVRRCQWVLLYHPIRLLFLTKISQKNTHILQSNRLDLRVEIRPLQDLIPGHTLILHDFARLATEDSDLGAVTLEHEGAEHGASGGAVAVAHYELTGYRMSDTASIMYCKRLITYRWRLCYWRSNTRSTSCIE